MLQLGSINHIPDRQSWALGRRDAEGNGGEVAGGVGAGLVRPAKTYPHHPCSAQNESFFERRVISDDLFIFSQFMFLRNNLQLEL